MNIARVSETINPRPATRHSCEGRDSPQQNRANGLGTVRPCPPNRTIPGAAG